MLSENQIYANRYRLVKHLGKGAYSEVWKAEDTKVGNLTVALKIYAPDKGLDENGIKMFGGEFAIVFNLHHQNLLTPSSFDEENGSPYLVMPYCEQGSTRRLVGTMGERQVAHFLRDVSSALDYLHESEIVHQDIKPDNVLVDSNGNFLVTDFGISTKLRSTLRMSVGLKSTAGTTAYMGPERFSKIPIPIKSSDIWSMGATVFELMTGDAPFGDMGGGLQKNGADIPYIGGEYSPELKTLVTRCLAQEPWNRPTAATVRDICEHFLQTGQWNLSSLREISEPEQDSQRTNRMSEEKDPEPQAEKKPDNPTPRKKKSSKTKKMLKILLIAAAVILFIAIISSIGKKSGGTEFEPVDEDSTSVVVTDTVPAEQSIPDLTRRQTADTTSSSTAPSPTTGTSSASTNPTTRSSSQQSPRSQIEAARANRSSSASGSSTSSSSSRNTGPNVQPSSNSQSSSYNERSNSNNNHNGVNKMPE